MTDEGKRDRRIRLVDLSPGVIRCIILGGKYFKTPYVLTSEGELLRLKDTTYDNITDRRMQGTVTSIAVHPEKGEILYAGTSDGRLFMSLDGGTHWGFVCDRAGGISALTIDPTAP